MSGWAVDAGWRNHSVQLVTRFFRQPNVDLWLNTTANEPSAKVVTFFKASRVPSPNSQRLLWVTGASGLAREMLERRGAWAANLLQYPVGFAIYLNELRSTLRRPKQSRPTVRLTGFDERFDRFWGILRQQSSRLLAVRNREALEWQYRVCCNNEIVILATESGLELSGYVILASLGPYQQKRRRLEVVDLQALGDSVATMRDLLISSLRFAQQNDYHAVGVTGQPPFKRAPLEGLRPRRSPPPQWPVSFYRLKDPALVADQQSPDTWDFGPFDGDSIF
jgi:hypothetical protein